MKTVVEYLGKVSITVEEEEWSIDKAYDRLTLVTSENEGYISRTAIPKGVELTNTKYWKFLFVSETVKEDIRRIKQQITAIFANLENLDGALENVQIDVNALKSIPVYKGAGAHDILLNNNSNVAQNGSTAEGSETQAIGAASHAEGSNTKAGANNSHAEGEGTEISTWGGHVEGTYNYTKEGIHIIGIGEEDDKKDAEVIDATGNKYLIGVGGYEGTIRTGKKTVQTVINEAYTTATNIAALVPAQATLNNKLADKDFVNSSIATNTATFKGTFTSESDLQNVNANANDYAFVIDIDASGNTQYKRYKYVVEEGEPDSWEYEYTLNNSSFTAAQWATINSGATAELVNKIEPMEEEIRNLDERMETEIVHAIFDVTKENTGAAFASLSVLLLSPNLSTLIPTNVRTGGMTIRFANTSDNKYVQYRYMETVTTADIFTNVANWQGVDEVPVDNSKNLVQSGGVLKYADNAVADKAGKLSDFFMYQNWLQVDGNYLGAGQTHLNYKCVCVPIVSGDVIKISKAVSTNAYCAFLKSESNVDNFIESTPAADLCIGESRRTIETVASNPQTLTAPSDAAYLYVGIYNGTDCAPEVFTINGSDYTKSVKEHITSLNSKIAEINAELYIPLVLPTTEWKDKSFNAATGTDGIFFDKRNKISAANRLTKIGVKATNAGIIKIHYLSTTSPYAEIANETHQVVSGVNEFEPSSNLTYDEEMYVAFSNDAASNPAILLVYPSDHTGQSIKKVIDTGVISEQDYPYALWIYTNENRLSDIEEKIDETGGITTLSALKSALSDNIGHIRLGAGTITLDGTISIPSGTKISGVRGKSVISVPASVLKGIELNGKEDIVIEDITLVGAYNGTPLKSALQPVKSGIVDSADDARQFINAGYQTDLTNGGVTSTYIPQIGINIKECEKIEIIGCEIKNFSFYGIANALSGKNYRYACKFENNYINNCYCGIYIYKEAERSQYIANNISLCQIGLYMDSGTNMFTDCAFSANRIGVFMNNGWNHAHGVHTGNAFTHCSLYSLYAYNIENGEVFSQCKFGYVDNETENNGNAIYAKNSRGLVFNNCQMIQCDIKFDGKFYLHYTGKTTGAADQFGNTNYVVTYEDISGQASQYNGGVSQILGSCYISGGGTITLSSDLDATNIIMKNNFFISGQDSSGVNN